MTTLMNHMERTYGG